MANFYSSGPPRGLASPFIFPPRCRSWPTTTGPARARWHWESIRRVFTWVRPEAQCSQAFWASHGWRWPFFVLGLAGMAYALFLGVGLVEPVRGQSELAKPTLDDSLVGDELGHGRLKGKLVRQAFPDLEQSCRRPAPVCLRRANFVAATFLTWLTHFIYEKFSMSLSGSSTISTAWSLSSLAGASAAVCLPTGWRDE